MAQNPQNTLYRSREVSEILGISRRQLQYWAHTDLVKPSAQTDGGHYRYAFRDLVALKASKRLIDSGVSLQRIRKSIITLRKLLPTIESPLSELVLVATGDVVLVFRDNTVFEAVSGQEWVLEVAAFQSEVDQWRAEVDALNTAKRAANNAAKRAHRPLKAKSQTSVKKSASANQGPLGAP